MPEDTKTAGSKTSGSINPNQTLGSIDTNPSQP